METLPGSFEVYPSLEKIILYMKEKFLKHENNNKMLEEKIKILKTEFYEFSHNKTFLENELNQLKEEIKNLKNKFLEIKKKINLNNINNDNQIQFENSSDFKANVQCVEDHHNKFYLQGNNIQKLQIEFEINNIHQTIITSLTHTEDNRIITGSMDGSLSICSLDFIKKTWKIDVLKNDDAQDGWIVSLCLLQGNKFVSANRYDYIKIWKIELNDITLIKQIKTHNHEINKIITLTKNRFASCSSDDHINLFRNDDNYSLITTINHREAVKSIIQLKQKEELIACGISYLTFWHLNTYKQINIINNCGIEHPSALIEISNNKIALSSKHKVNNFAIIIINCNSYQIITKIVLENYITESSFLSSLNKYSFIYLNENTFVQISSDDYSILFKSKEENFSGSKGMIGPFNDRFLVIANNQGLSIIKVVKYEN